MSSLLHILEGDRVERRQFAAEDEMQQLLVRLVLGAHAILNASTMSWCKRGGAAMSPACRVSRRLKRKGAPSAVLTQPAGLAHHEIARRQIPIMLGRRGNGRIQRDPRRSGTVGGIKGKCGAAAARLAETRQHAAIGDNR